MSAVVIPHGIHRGDGEIVVTWDADHVATYPARDLRLKCPCAQCVEEMTGRPLLEPATVPKDVTALSIGLVGSYAVRIDWSDGHGTGIYTYELLRAMCPCEQCAAGRQSGRAAE